MPAPLHRIPAASSVPLHLVQPTRLVAERDQLITGVAGIAWVTLDHEPRDAVLASGDRLVLPAGRLATVTALSPRDGFELRVAPNGATAAPRPRATLHTLPRGTRPPAWRRVLRLLGSVFGLSGHRPA
jgi:hypothetical protein